MKALPWALVLVVASALAGAAKGEPNGPPGGVIEHIGPLSRGGDFSATPPLQAPALTAAQKTAIFRAVMRDKFETNASGKLEVIVGEPAPTVELHPLPADVLGEAPAARPYRYTVLADEVVLVDPRTLRVVDVIKP